MGACYARGDLLGVRDDQDYCQGRERKSEAPVPQVCPWKNLMVQCWEEHSLDRLEFSKAVELFDEVGKHLPPSERRFELLSDDDNKGE